MDVFYSLTNRRMPVHNIMVALYPRVKNLECCFGDSAFFDSLIDEVSRLPDMSQRSIGKELPDLHVLLVCFWLKIVFFLRVFFVFFDTT